LPVFDRHFNDPTGTDSYPERIQLPPFKGKHITLNYYIPGHFLACHGNPLSLYFLEQAMSYIIEKIAPGS